MGAGSSSTGNLRSTSISATEIGSGMRASGTVAMSPCTSSTSSTPQCAAAGRRARELEANEDVAHAGAGLVLEVLGHEAGERVDADVAVVHLARAIICFRQRRCRRASSRSRRLRPANRGAARARRSRCRARPGAVRCTGGDTGGAWRAGCAPCASRW